MPDATDGRLILDGVPLQLLPRRGGGFAWELHTGAELPGQSDPDEAKVTRAPAQVRRTLPYLDWSGGIGAAKVVSGRSNRRLHYSEGASGRHPGRLVRAHEVRTVTPADGGGSVTDFFEINSRLYAVIGPTVRRVTPTLNAETVAARASDGAGSGDATGVYISTLTFTTATPLWYDGTSTKVFLGTTDAADPAVSFDGTATWAQDNASFWGYASLSQSTDGQRLWVSSCPTDTNGVYVANLAAGQDPFAATTGTTPWSSRFPLGNRAAAITSLSALRDGVIATTGDGQVYQFDYATGLPTPLLNSDGLIPDSDNGLGAGVWNGILVVPTPRGLLMYDEQSDGPGVFRPIGMEMLRGHEMPIRGRCTALYCGDPEYLWAAFYNGTDSYVLGGRFPYEDEAAETRFVWDTVGVGKIASRKVTSLHITHLESTANQPILCIGTSTPDCHFVTLPRPGWTELQDDNCRSRTSAHSVFLPDHDGGAPTTYKPFRRLRFKLNGFGTSEYADVSVRVDRGNFTEVGRIEDVPIATLNLPTGTEGMSLGIQIEFAGTTALATFPSIEAVEVDVTESPEPSQWIDVAVYMARNQHGPSGTGIDTPEALVDFLNRLAGQVRHVEAKGPNRKTYQVKVDPFYGIHPVPAEQVEGKEIAYACRFRLNVYDELLEYTGMRWDVDPWTGGTRTSRWG